MRAPKYKIGDRVQYHGWFHERMRGKYGTIILLVGPRHVHVEFDNGCVQEANTRNLRLVGPLEQLAETAE